MIYAILTYLLLSGIGLGLFYLPERLFLKEVTHFKWRRFYYLVAILLSFLLPLLAQLVPFNLLSLFSSKEVIVPVMLDIETSEMTILGVVQEGTAITLKDNLLTFFLLLWAVGVLVVWLRYVIGWVQLRKLVAAAEPQYNQSGELLYYLLKGEATEPFTSGKKIYIPDSYTLQEETLEMVLLHEQTHQQQKHYIDLLIANICTTVQWWNPFAWGVVAAMRENLEYLADREVVRVTQERGKYQRQLLGSALGVTAGPWCATYSIYKLKKRIEMMNKKRTSQMRAWAYVALMLPVALVMAAASNVLLASNNNRNVEEPRQEVVQVDEPMATPEVVVEELVQEPSDVPTFMGGQKALLQYLMDNLKYPPEAVKENISGNVIVRFDIDKDGSVSNPTIVRGAHPALDKEALRVVSVMPKWQPAKGQTGKVKMTIPVRFSLGTKQKAENKHVAGSLSE